MHYEDFEVITAENGASSLSFELACATAMDHYIRCTAPHEKQETDKYTSPCSTGLRVYEGARVLAAFVARFGRVLLRYTFEYDTFRYPSSWVVELGCGCGLVGFTAATLFPELSVAFTDASVDCLNLIGASAERNGLKLIQINGKGFSGVFENNEHRVLVAYPLEWCEDDTVRLISTIRRFSNSPNHVKTGDIRMVLGSDLLYYRVDIKALLTTCKCLLQSSEETASKDQCNTSLAPRLAILAHFMRIPDGDAKLQMAAYELGFGIVRVPLEAVVDADVIKNRGWNGISVVLLFLRSPPHTDLHCLNIGNIFEQHEEEDLAEVKRIFSVCHISFPSEALVCYSKKALGNNADAFVDCEKGSDLDNLPFFF
ncbi:hypothetical protein BCY84_06551 [Trypanosoma cruzi cruzi]|uniref:Methyltransferase small domain-containing protein n=1 Tax=Trypanosoma cruzi TaxID=5693 RepID=A0A2V2V7M0_TRYCR|nr:hypothetical protein BCY84_06551 [Trypanosoma cruzi cruzi]PWU92497.1 hypothetical protein C4B63_37g44 [Trypanosoma cruzi]